MSKKTTTHRLTEMPDDVYEIIIKEQAKAKIECKCQRSIEWTIYNLLRRVK